MRFMPAWKWECYSVAPILGKDKKLLLHTKSNNEQINKQTNINVTPAFGFHVAFPSSYKSLRSVLFM